LGRLAGDRNHLLLAVVAGEGCVMAKPVSSGVYVFHAYGKSYSVEVVRQFYGNGRTALTLVDLTGERVAVATVNLPEVDLPPGHAHIKTWSENEGMLDFLVRNGLAKDTGIDVPTGFVDARLVELIEVV